MYVLYVGTTHELNLWTVVYGSLRDGGHTHTHTNKSTVGAKSNNDLINFWRARESDRSFRWTEDRPAGLKTTFDDQPFYVILTQNRNPIMIPKSLIYMIAKQRGYIMIFIVSCSVYLENKSLSGTGIYFVRTSVLI